MPSVQACMPSIHACMAASVLSGTAAAGAPALGAPSKSACPGLGWRRHQHMHRRAASGPQCRLAVGIATPTPLWFGPWLAPLRTALFMCTGTGVLRMHDGCRIWCGHAPAFFLQHVAHVTSLCLALLTFACWLAWLVHQLAPALHSWCNCTNDVKFEHNLPFPLGLSPKIICGLMQCAAYA